MIKVLVVDDEPDVVEVINLGLRLNSPDWEVLNAEEGREALNIFRKENPDLVILDMSMPGMGGLEVCRAIRLENKDVPIIFLTVRDDEIEKVRGLEAGADDYVTKPFSPLELMARIRALLRRTNPGKVALAKTIFNHENLNIDFSNRRVILDGEQIRLTSTEYNLLFFLVSNPGRVIPHEFLLSKVWGPEYRDAQDYLKVHIRHLREKLGDDAQNPRFIFTERSKGYRFVGTIEG